MALGTVAQILVNMGSTIYADSLVVVHSMSGTGHVRLYYGTAYDWSFTGTLEAGHEVDNDYGTTARFLATGTAQYWGIEVDGRQYVGTGIKIYETFLGKRLELTQNPQYPYATEEERSVTVGETTKGIRHTYYNFARNSWLLEFRGMSSGDKSSVETMLDYTNGPNKPLWYTENPNALAETYFVRFASQRFTFQELPGSWYDLVIPLEQEL